MTKELLQILRNKLEAGDRDLIIKKVKCSRETYVSTFSGKRKGPLSKKVIEAAIELVEKKAKQEIELKKRIENVA